MIPNVIICRTSGGTTGVQTVRRTGTHGPRVPIPTSFPGPFFEIGSAGKGPGIGWSQHPETLGVIN